MSLFTLKCFINSKVLLSICQHPPQICGAVTRKCLLSQELHFPALWELLCAKRKKAHIPTLKLVHNNTPSTPLLLTLPLEAGKCVAGEWHLQGSQEMGEARGQHSSSCSIAPGKIRDFSALISSSSFPSSPSRATPKVRTKIYPL